MKASDFAEIIKWGVIGVIAYEVYKKVSSVGQTATDIGNQVSELGDTTADPQGLTFASWYDPTQRTVFFYWLTFPDGNHHLVWSSSVAADGTFVFSDGTEYRIGVDKAGGLRAYFNG